MNLRNLEGQSWPTSDCMQLMLTQLLLPACFFLFFVTVCNVDAVVTVVVCKCHWPCWKRT